MDLSQEEKLVLLAEECGEVTQAATKCIRFGWERTQQGYGCNKDVLAREVGDLLGVVDALGLDWSIIGQFRAEKMRKAERVKQELGRVN